MLHQVHGWVDHQAYASYAPTCGNPIAMEHNGDMYSCDHFIEPRFTLGKIRDEPMINLVGSEKQRKYSQDKLNSLSKYCLECAVRFHVTAVVIRTGPSKHKMVNPA
ncbi:SPASM domain-containing protein [Chloroflexota bacterium]